MRTAAAAALAAGVTVAVYWGALSSGFVGDDFMILHRLREGGSLLRFFRGEFFEYYRPLGFVAHAIDYRMAGASPAQFHATNLLVHVGSVVLVLLIGRALSPRTIAGPLAAFLFALTPRTTKRSSGSRRASICSRPSSRCLPSGCSSAATVGNGPSPMHA